MVKQRSSILIILALLTNSTTGVSQPDLLITSHDTLNYLCSFDFKLDGVGTSKIFKPSDKDLVRLVSNIEQDVRASNYISVYECGFVRTAGVTWRNNKQILLYNPERIKALRAKYPNKDSLSILFKGIVLHEIGHHCMPHTVIRLARKKQMHVDSIKIFEEQADNYMGQMLRRVYGVKAPQARYIINQLVDEKDDANQYFPKKKRVDHVMDGWQMGGHTLAAKSPMYNMFLKMQEGDDPISNYSYTMPDLRDLLPVIKQTDSLKLTPLDTLRMNSESFETLAQFQIRRVNRFEYLFIKSPNRRLHKATDFVPIAAIADSSDPLFPRFAYDQYFVTWYITEANDVYALSEGTYILLGRIK